jgi:hypothetical protein
MSERHQNQQPIANWVTAGAGSGQQAVDLAFGQVLTLPVIGIFA